MDCRLIIDEPSDGAWNMAVDEALLLSVGGAGQGSATLRFYRWRQPTLSLGYFQRHADRQSHHASRDCPLVRRSTGGGAILHDQELTYSFAIAVNSHVGVDLRDYYFAFHETLIATLQTFEVEAELCSPPPTSKEREEPFLCFQRRAEGDVLLQGYKICGSAQRRHRGALLQHGSLLLNKSPAAPELPGANNLAQQAVTPEQIQNKWTPIIGKRLGLDFSDQPLTSGETELAGEILSSKFGNANWTRKR